ncbi:MAG: PQQ-binding-like beta-propeller repeat protein [Verrucomicrobiaceae bacterium]
MDNEFYFGVKGHVVCIDPATGIEKWKTHLKSSYITNLVIHDILIIAHTKGELFGLRKDNGKILWRNPLTGLGYGSLIFATGSQSTVNILAHEATQQAAAANGGGTGAT